MPVIHFGWSNACCKGSLLKFILKDKTSMEELQPRLLPPRRVMQFGSPKSCRMEGVLPLQWRFFFFVKIFAIFCQPMTTWCLSGCVLKLRWLKRNFLLKIHHFHLGMGGGSPKIPVNLTENCWWRWERLYFSQFCWRFLRFAELDTLGSWVLRSH